MRTFPLPTCLFLLASLVFAQDLLAQDWQLAAEMEQARFRHETIVLDDGRVLLVGGTTSHDGPSLVSCELFDYRDNSVVPAGDLNVARQSMRMLKLRDGRVLVVGGSSYKNSDHVGIATNTAEIYDPVTDSWTLTAAMQIRRDSYRMAELPDGKILVSGGVGGSVGDNRFDILASCEIFDPVNQTWEPTAAMRYERTAHGITTLNDGRVLVSGGYGNGMSRCEIFDPVSQSWSDAASFLEGGSAQHTTTVISEGRILRTGGWPGPQQWSEIYDPLSDSWRSTIGRLQQRRFAAEAVTQPNGQILLVGGLDQRKSGLTSSELYDPATENWMPAEDLPHPNVNFGMVILPNQQALITGGSHLINDNVERVHSELYISTFQTGENSAVVSGRLWRDYDEDCEFNGNDKSAGDNLLEFSPGGHLVMTDADGCFETLLPPGNYTLSAVNDESWQQHCPANALNFAVAGDLQPVENLQLGMRPIGAFSYLNVSLVSSRARPGFELRYVLRYQNVGTTAFNGTLSFNYSEALDFVSSSLAVDVDDQGLLVWEMRGIAPDESGVIELLFTVPADESLIGTGLCATLLARDEKRQDVLLREREEDCVEVTGSYDPNDLAVFPKGFGELGTVSLDVRELAYLVRFQNTGNDTAFTVRLLDTLHDAHLVRSVRLGAASHPFKLNILQGGILEFSFSDINLPYQDQDELASQGFVKFYISRQEDLTNQTTIDNQVAIYFDFNKPIFTNTVNTTFDASATDVVSKPLAELNIELYPNPVVDRATVSFAQAGQLDQLELRDLMGRSIARQSLGADSLFTELNLAALPAGTYQLIARDNEGTARAVRSLVVQR